MKTPRDERKIVRTCPDSVPISLLALLLAMTLSLPALAKDQKLKNTGTPNTANLVWPLPPEKPRIRYIESISNNFEVEPRKKLSFADRLIGKPDPNVEEVFTKAAGVAVDSKGRIILTATQRHTVYVLDKGQKQVLKIRGGRGIVFHTPVGVAVDQQDNIYVSDPVQHFVVKMTSEGEVLATLGGGSKMKNPTFVATDFQRNRLYVVDAQLHQVLVFSLETMQLTGRFGKRGEKNGEFNFPVGIAVNKEGHIAVSDTGSCSVQVFSPEFKFLRRLGSQGMKPGMFVRPKGVAYDSEGHLYVADAAFSNFQIFDEKGRVLMFVGGPGQEPGNFNMPLGMYVDARDRIYVADQLNNRIQVFQFLGGN